ncbi:hypothetical protein H6F90_01390 [Trichocoleus sp. FACHB-591]|uniref:hypothetical protein n=1 Tax=Trichocoleus sp. FACHB-591 TaxID=2692872 RepID=UPI0019CA5CC7|nr:hypothetical protein [Trichocoleus sp. FACHB-591]MBD2093807.1 hypothetical protein [Trichocoleus sp. FACHB-591]
MMLPFTYTCDVSLTVYEQSKQYLEEQSDIAKQLSELAWAYKSIGKVIPTTTENLWSGHFFPWHDSWEEIQVSYNLCMLGFYKQAMTSLRGSFELGLLSVYWNLNDDGHEIIQSWLRSDENTPRFGDIWRKLEQHPNFLTYQQHHNIKQRLLDLGYLHDYVHAKGHKFSNAFGISKSNKQTFEKTAFDTWFSAYKEVVDILCSLHLVKYPIGVIRFDYSAKFGINIPFFGGLDEFEVDRLEQVIGQAAFQIIQSIAASDSTVQNLLNWITSLPDISEAEAQTQLIEGDKSLIKAMGFNNWANMMHQSISIAGNKLSEHETAIYEQRLEHLRQWSEENGYDKPLIEGSST